MDLKTFHLTLVLSLFCFSSLTAPKALAQIEGNNPVVHDAINDAYIVGGSGVVGAVLGLSTLSFVEKPGDHLKNIVVGGAIGIIIGVSVVAWGQANKSRQNYDYRPSKFPSRRIFNNRTVCLAL